MPEISVILPFCNAQQTLERAVISVLQQSFTDFELLLVNNNSTDNSNSVAEQLRHKDERIRLFSEKKQGVVFASQTGLSHASAGLIARADADDYWHQNKLQLQYDYLMRHDDIDVVSCCVNYKGSEKNKGMRLYVEETNKYLDHDQILLNRFTELQIINPTIMFRKEVVDKHGFYREGNFPEDYELFLRWTERGVKYHKLEQRLLDWYDHEKRLTRTDNRYSYDAFYRIKAHYLNNYLKLQNPFYPDVVIWGAGNKSKKRSAYITKYGAKIKHYIDVDKNKAVVSEVVWYKDIPGPGKCFIVSYVNNRGAGDEIRRFLINRGYKEGKDFILA